MSIHFFPQSQPSESTQSPLRLNNEAKECYERAKQGIHALEERVSVVEKKRERLASTSPDHPRIKHYTALIEKTNETLVRHRDKLKQLETTISRVETLVLVSKL